MRGIALALALVVACQGSSGVDTQPIGSASGAGSATGAGAGFGSAGGGSSFGSAIPAPGSDVGSDEPHPKIDEPDPDPPQKDETGAKAIAELGAIPAWQAVVDRARYLARRGQHGVVYGLVGGPVMVPAPRPPPDATDAGVAAPRPTGPTVDAGLVASPYTWLVDDTDGNGALAIRVSGKELEAGARVALGGAWALDDAKQWFWKIEVVSPLPAQPPPADGGDLRPAGSAAEGRRGSIDVQPPGHAIAIVERLPAGAHMMTFAKEGELAYFQVVGAAPAVDGDGWPVADELGNPVYALLNLPGERPTYGAQDMRSKDERWALKRGVTYVVRLGKIRKHGPDKPVTINARSAPVMLK